MNKSNKLYAKLTAAALVTSAIAVPAVASAAEERLSAMGNNATGTDNDTITVSNIPAGAKSILYYQNSDSTSQIWTIVEGNPSLSHEVSPENGTVTIKRSGGFNDLGLYRLVVKVFDEESGDGNLLGTAVVHFPNEIKAVAYNNPGTDNDYIEITDIPEGATNIKYGLKDRYDEHRIGTGEGQLAVSNGSATLKIEGGFPVDLKNSVDYLAVVRAMNDVPNDSSLLSETYVYVPIDPADKPKEEESTEAQSTVIKASNVKATDNVTLNDVVYVTGVKAKDLVTVYDDKGASLGKTTAKKDGTVVIKLKKNSLDSQTKISVGVRSVGEKGKKLDEFKLDSVAVKKPLTSTTLDAAAITVNNLEGTKKDTVVVAGVPAKATVYVYSDAEMKNQIGTAKSSKGGTVPIKINNGTTGLSIEKVYVAIVEDNKNKSGYVEVASSTADAASISYEELHNIYYDEHLVDINNLPGTKDDTIVLKKIPPKAIVTIYPVDTNGKPITEKAQIIGTGKPNKFGTVTIKVKNGLVVDSTFAIGIKEVDKTETIVEYWDSIWEEQKTEELYEEQLTFTNYASGKDQLYITGLKSTDVINVYEDGKKVGVDKPLATSKVKDGTVAITLKKNYTKGEKLLVTVTDPYLPESVATTITVGDELLTELPVSNFIDGVFLSAVENKTRFTIVDTLPTTKYTIYDETGKVLNSAESTKTGIVEIDVDVKLDDIKDKFQVGIKGKENSELRLDATGKQSAAQAAYHAIDLETFEVDLDLAKDPAGVLTALKALNPEHASSIQAVKKVEKGVATVTLAQGYEATTFIEIEGLKEARNHLRGKIGVAKGERNNKEAILAALKSNTSYLGSAAKKVVNALSTDSITIANGLATIALPDNVTTVVVGIYEYNY